MRKNMSYTKTNLFRQKRRIESQPVSVQGLPLGFIVLLFFIFSLPTHAQDIHFAQFHNAPFYINPGLTGIFNGNVRFSGNFKNQWRSVPVDYQTYSLGIDSRFTHRQIKDGFFSGGILLDYDRSGYSRLTLQNFGLHLAYAQQLGRQVFLSLGGSATVNQRSFDISGLTFDNQYNEVAGAFDPVLSPDEAFLTDNSRRIFMSYGTGLNFRYQSSDNRELIDRLEKRTKIDAGLGIFHLNRPNQSFIEGFDQSLSMRFVPYIFGTFKLGDELDLIVNMAGFFQGPYRETITVLGGRLHLDRTPGRQLSVQANFGLRFEDGLVPGIEFFYQGLRFGMNYDLNTSEFDVATAGRGGPEISVGYILKFVPRLAYKACPII